MSYTPASFSSVNASWEGVSAYTPKAFDEADAVWVVPSITAVLSWTPPSGIPRILAGLRNDSQLSWVAPSGYLRLTALVGNIAKLEWTPPSGYPRLLAWHRSLTSPYWLWPGASSDGTNLTFAIADLYGVTSAEADATTGSWPEVVQGILLTAKQYLDEMPYLEQPKAMRFYVREDWNYEHPDLGRVLKRKIRSEFVTDYLVTDVADEPGD